MAKGNWRDELDNALLDVLRNQGVEEFLQVGVDFLNVDPRGDTKLRSQVSGEVCEVILVGLSMNYAQVAKRKMRVYHSVVLKDLRDKGSDFRTELDAVIVTPYFILTTECKSYFGEVSIVDQCSLVHFGTKTDVWRQSKLHHMHLMNYAKQFVSAKIGMPQPPVFANAFVFSNSRLLDKRSQAGKRSLRVLTASNLIQYYEAMFKRYTTPIFDFDRACRVIGKCASSIKLHEDHKRFLGY